MMEKNLISPIFHHNHPNFIQAQTYFKENNFLSAAASLFVIAARVSKLSSGMDPLELQDYLIKEIYQIENQLQKENIRAEQILIAKYFFCSLLDDLIEHEWLDGQGLWRAYSLRFYFFQENGADERLLPLIDRLQQEPIRNRPLLECAYLVLIYGYQGHFRQLDNGYYKLLAKIDELYHILSSQHGDFRKSLFIQ